MKENDGRKNNGNKGHSTKTRRVGRPALEVDEESILKLAQVGMTDAEICYLLDISISVLQNFRSTLQKGRSNLSQSVKRTQLDVALRERSIPMLIWVGRQYCDQKEKKELVHTGDVERPQVVVYGNNTKTWDDENKSNIDSILGD